MGLVSTVFATVLDVFNVVAMLLMMTEERITMRTPQASSRSQGLNYKWGVRRGCLMVPVKADDADGAPNFSQGWQ
jgi:hypothetical protein